MRPSFAGTILIALGAAGCESSRWSDGVACTAQFVYGLAVTVQDKAAGQRICDAEVVAVTGSFRETLPAFGPPESCTYAGAGERPGVYELRASKPGFQLATVTGIRVYADQCHVIPARVTIEMER
jgi:hypothetical protein